MLGTDSQFNQEFSICVKQVEEELLISSRANSKPPV
jgi:hypothetical protein